MQVFNVGVLDVGFKLFAPQGERRLAALLVVSCCTGLGVYGKIVSQPLLPVRSGAFSRLPNI